MRNWVFAFGLMLGLSLCVTTGGAIAGSLSDEVAIERLMRETWEGPDAPLATAPVVIAGDYAIADWTQSENGGRALLRKKNDAWAVVLCAGDALKDATTLRDAGLPAETASTLAEALAAAEMTVDPARRAMFSRFDGLVTMGEDGTAPGDDGHGGHGHHDAEPQ